MAISKIAEPIHSALRLVVMAIVLSSCSASYHFKRAIAKDPSIIKNDTTIVEKIIEGTTVGEDSVEVNTDLVWIKALGLGKIKLDYKVKTKVVTDVTTVDPPKTKTEVRQENRTKRTEARQSGKTDRVQIKYKYKTIKVTEQKNDLLYIGIAIGLAISYLVYRMWKRFFS